MTDLNINDESEHERARAARRQFQASINTCVPAKVFEVFNQFVSVTLVIQREFNNEAQAPLVLNDLPVIFPHSNGYGVRHGIQPGDTGLVLFCQRDISAWRSGTDGVPETPRMHDYSDAVFLPGLTPDAQAKPVPQGSVRIEAGNTAIELTDSGRIDIENAQFNLIGVLLDALTSLSTATADGKPLSSNANVAVTVAKLKAFQT